MGNFTIRRASPDDAAQLACFPCKNHAEKWTRDVERVIRADVAAIVNEGDETVDVFVAVDDENVIGVVTTQPTEVEEEPDAKAGSIPVLAVVPDRRREGVGIALKRRVLELWADRGGQVVVSEVHSRNVAMNALNEVLGVRVAGRNPDATDYNLTAARLPESTAAAMERSCDESPCDC